MHAHMMHRGCMWLSQTSQSPCGPCHQISGSKIRFTFGTAHEHLDLYRKDHLNGCLRIISCRDSLRL